MDPNQFTNKAAEALQHAVAEATARSHQAVTPDHILLGLLSRAQRPRRVDAVRSGRRYRFDPIVCGSLTRRAPPGPGWE